MNHGGSSKAEGRLPMAAAQKGVKGGSQSSIAEGRMTKVGLPENTEVVGENTEVDWLSGKRPGDAVSTVYADVIDWQSRRCISSIPRRHFFADEEERCLANRLAVVLRRRKRRLAWRSDVGKRRLGGPPGKRRLACRADQVPTYPCRAKLTKVEADLINSIPGVRAIRSYTSSRAADMQDKPIHAGQRENAGQTYPCRTCRRICGKKKTTYPRRRKTPVLEKTALTKTPALETTPIAKNIAPNKSRAGTVWTECASKRSRVAQLCDDLSLWSQWRRMLRASTASVPHDASAECCHMNTPSELSLRGINIQYPFSRLILSGVKTVEVRTYRLGDRNLGGANEDLFLIETPGSRNLKGALLDRRYPIGPPPSVAQVIGIVRFSSSEQYANKPTSRYQWHMPSWNKHRSKHRIKEGGHYDWNRKDAMYAWYVDNVQPFSEPVPAGEKCLWGYRRPRTLEVTLM